MRLLAENASESGLKAASEGGTDIRCALLAVTWLMMSGGRTYAVETYVKLLNEKSVLPDILLQARP